MWLRSSILLFAVSCFGQGVEYTYSASGILTLTHNGVNRLGAHNNPQILSATFAGTVVSLSCTTALIDNGFRYICNNGSPGHSVYDVTFGGAGTDTFSARFCITNSDTLGRPITNIGIDRYFSLEEAGSTLDEDAAESIGYPESVAKKRVFSTYSATAYVTEWNGLGVAWAATNGKISTVPTTIFQQSSSTIPAGDQKCVTLYVAYGSPSATISEQAAPGYAAYRAAFPQQLQWPDRRPLALMFLAQQQRRSETNPRGWSPGSAADYLGAGFSSARTSLLSTVNLFLNNADTISPRPQAACWWDWGGEEFNHVFTYVGYPGSDSGSHLFSLAPELETETNGVPLIDEVFSVIKSRGYEPCMTLRPHHVWQSGAGRPTGVCYAQGTFDGQAYLDTSASYPNRGYRCQEGGVTFDDANDLVLCPSCLLLQNGSVVRLYALTGTLPTALSSSTNYYIQNFAPGVSFQISTDPEGMNIVTDFSGGSGTYQEESWIGPVQLGGHEVTHSYLDALDMMKQAIRFANQRWKINIFYIDSTYYKKDGQIGRQNETIGTYFWRELVNEFPGVLLMPENSPSGPSYAKFLSTTVNRFSTSQVGSAVRLYPQVFHAVHLNGNYHDRPDNQAVVRDGMAQGDIYMFSVNALGTVENQGKTDLATALDAMRTITMTDRGQARTFRSDPGAAFRYPLVSRVYFAASAEGLAASTTYCERKEIDRCYLSGTLQETATLDLSSRPYYQLRYYDYAGGLVSNPGIYGVIQ